MKTCMLRPVRTGAGLGSPPNKWENNRTESLHSIMKEGLRNESLDIGTFLERVKDRDFGQQVEEMIGAIYGMGEYRLSDNYQQCGNANAVSEMSAIQRKALTKKVFKLN